MTKHTPGPWRWTDGDEDIDITTYVSPGYYRNPELKGATGTSIVGCDEYWTIGPSFGPKEEMHANAHLIAAAPDLLEALKAYIAFVDRLEGKPSTRTAAEHAEVLRGNMRAAIAKAKGVKS